MPETFALHPQLAADTHVVGDWPLCRVLLMNDQQYPWCILVPRRQSIRESYELTHDDQQQLWAESLALGQTLMRLYQGDKLNVAALGNMVPQLHWHHIVRFKSDPAWPAPVWGKLPPKAYAPAESERLLQSLRLGLNQSMILEN